MLDRYLKASVPLLAAAVLALTPSTALAQAEPGTDPKPIPFGPFGPGFDLPAPGHELSLITDLDGFVGRAHLTGTATETNTTTGVVTTNLPYEADVAFMQGNYIGVDGQTHFGTFVFL